MAEEPSKIKVLIKSCPVQTVVVYKDSAEVCRSYSSKIDAGEREIIFTEICGSVDQDSIRVDGVGNAIINEVAYSETHLVEREENQDEKVTKLEDRQKELEGELELLDMQRKRLLHQRKVLDSFADQYVQKPVATQKDSTQSLCNKLGDELPDAMTTFLDTYATKCEERDTKLHSLQLKGTELKKELDTIPQQLRNLRAGNRSMSRQISVLLDVKEQCDMQLRLFYVVRNASWTPRYDIRVFSSNKTMKIAYYGTVKQSTGEDWNDAKLLLSTANPNIGGTLPKLGKLLVSPKASFVARRTRTLKSNAMSLRVSARYSEESCAADMDNFAASRNAFAAVQEMDTEVFSGMTNTTFEIQRLASIPSDGIGHKVSVALVDFNPEFSYETVPKKSSYVFLRVNTVNNSKYAMLQGPCNVFLDNNFICKSELQDVFPGEEFHSWLGVDSAVRVVYEPVKRYNQNQGLIQRTQLNTSTQAIKVKNSHDYDIVVVVRDHVPESSDQKIKVSLVEPFLNKTPVGEWRRLREGVDVSVTEHQHVLWRVALAPQQGQDLRMQYTIETSRGQELEFTEVSLPDGI